MNAALDNGRHLVWLASYPKSGNTWLRAMLTAFLEPESEVMLDRLVGRNSFLDRQALDDFAGIDSAQLSADELIPYQAMQLRAANEEACEAFFCKTHSARLAASDGTPLFPADATAGAILIVRNPIDIVPSYAHHEGKHFDRIIAMMGDEEAGLDLWSGKRSANLPQVMGSWSSHSASWADCDDFPVLVLRYEDLLDDPAGGLAKVLGFVGLEFDEAQLAAAVLEAQFDRLKQHEAAAGFAEKPSETREFFRSGTSGDGAMQLSDQQIEEVLRKHAGVMRRFGYPDTLSDYREADRA